MKASIINQATVLMLDKIDTVKVSFEPYVEGLTKLYTYKAPKRKYAAGDLAIVVANGTYKVVQVHSIDEIQDFDPYSEMQYKWLVQKLDLTDYNKCIQTEKNIANLLIEAERRAMYTAVQTELQERLGKSADQLILDLGALEDSKKKEEN